MELLLSDLHEIREFCNWQHEKKILDSAKIVALNYEKLNTKYVLGGMTLCS